MPPGIGMDSKFSAIRYHDFSYGHRVYGHESVCAHLHGHNGRVIFEVEASLDKVGRVLDFSAIKHRLCMWVENNWDHRFLIWEEDPLCQALLDVDETVVVLPVNPTAENLANYLLQCVGPEALLGTGVLLVRVTMEETRKCAATASLTY